MIPPRFHYRRTTTTMCCHIIIIYYYYYIIIINYLILLILQQQLLQRTPLTRPGSTFLLLAILFRILSATQGKEALSLQRAETC